MLHRILQGARPSPHGATIERPRVYGLVHMLGFLGRRRSVYTRIVELSGTQPGDRVLDVGCNGGYLARLLAARVGPNGRVTGVDPASKAIAYARRHAPSTCTFVVGAAQSLDLADRTFDVVTSTLALHHVREPDRPAALTEMYRVLRPGGRLLLADFRQSGHSAPFHRSAAHQHASIPLDQRVAAAGFDIESTGDLPMLRYVQAVRPT